MEGENIILEPKCKLIRVLKWNPIRKVDVQRITLSYKSGKTKRSIEVSELAARKANKIINFFFQQIT